VAKIERGGGGRMRGEGGVGEKRVAGEGGGSEEGVVGKQ